MKFKEKILKIMFSFNFLLCCRNALPKHKEKRILTNFFQLYFLSLNFFLTNGEICFSLATNLNTQVHFIKDSNHCMQSQLQLLRNADSKGLIFHRLSSINSLILRWKNYGHLVFFLFLMTIPHSFDLY